VTVAPVEAEAPGPGQFRVGDRDRFAPFDRRLDGLASGSFGVAVGTRARETQRSEIESRTDTVLEEHVDVRLTVDFDGFDVMLGHVASVPRSVAAQPLSRVGPFGSRRPWLRNRWDDLTFVNWRYPADEVQALLPEGLTVDTCEGDAWVSLVVTVPYPRRR
jgi:hypothetical protein